uniref:hypothetical protein n=1 Tax=Actinomadura formosensis TaxID=60706 RepID=UPI000A9F2BDC|nr:hypothetical protein [Actinomadura formosensis]
MQELVRVAGVRHITLAMLAHAYLAVTAAHAPKAAAAWSLLRRTRQARARSTHYWKRRLRHHHIQV